MSTPDAEWSSNKPHPPVDPDSFEHPTWCDRPTCTAHEPFGAHESAPWRVDRDGWDMPIYELFFWQDGCTPVHDLVSVVLRTTRKYGSRVTSMGTTDLEPDQMRRLAGVLAEVADRADAINEQNRRVAAEAAREDAERAAGGEPDDQ